MKRSRASIQQQARRYPEEILLILITIHITGLCYCMQQKHEILYFNKAGILFIRFFHSQSNQIIESGNMIEFNFLKISCYRGDSSLNQTHLTSLDTQS